jgi:1,4-alpha-glucan branching enzyme
MDPITMALLMAAPQLIGGVTNIIQGVKDRKEAERIKANAGPRPEYEIPESVDKMISLYEQQAAAGMPGEDIYKQDIQASTARTAGAAAQLADSPVAALTALGGAQQREIGALRDLQARAAMYQSQANQQVAQAYGQRAQWENLQFDYNQNQPWQIAQNQYWGLRNQGRQSINQGLDTAMSGIQSGIGAGMQTEQFNQMMPVWEKMAGE